MKDLKIKAIHIYQSATFDKRDENYFSALPIPHKRPLTLKYLEDMRAVEIESDYSHIIVPMDNIRAIYLWDAEAERYMVEYNSKYRFDSCTPTKKAKPVKE